MLGSMKFFAAVIVTAAAGLFAVGCQSPNSGSGDASAKQDMHSGDAMAMPADAAGGQAVTCDTCKVTWVKSPVTNSKGRVTAYTTTKSHECPECRGSVENFFATGNLRHDCATCGKDALQVCEAHTSSK
jgi:hypothetical protein